jgi:hypothetical protein
MRKIIITGRGIIENTGDINIDQGSQQAKTRRPQAKTRQALGWSWLEVSGMTPSVGRPDGLTILIKTNQALVLSWLEVVLSWLVENPG